MRAVRKAFGLGVIAALAVLCGAALAVSSDEVSITTIYQGTAAFEFSAPRAALAKLARWDGGGAPPMAVEAAVACAKKHATGAGCKLVMVELARIVDASRVAEEQGWYYKVTLRAAGQAFPEDFIVLFDGTVIRPKRIPKTF